MNLHASLVLTLTLSSASTALVQTLDDDEADTDLSSTVPPPPRPDFDFYVFAQLWPLSDCLAWEMETHKEHACVIPTRGRRALDFTVHGIWPTRQGEIGPIYCNKTEDDFRPRGVEPIFHKLVRDWANVRSQEEGVYGFWRHEWNKHGTCAQKVVPELATELEFFSKGLELKERFPVMQYLGNAGFLPGRQGRRAMTFDRIVEAVSGYTGAKPAVQCLADDASPELWQVWICLDLDFAPVDCDVIKGGLNHGCPKTGRIGYPDHELICQTGSIIHLDDNWLGQYLVSVIFGAAGIVTFAVLAHSALTYLFGSDYFKSTYVTLQ